MTISFLRPVGANADVNEIEYIAALHQTCQPGLRSDGSIKSIDIVHFLSSRYGIRVTEDEVRKTILKGLGGGDQEDECLDLTEVVSILLIPLLIKAASELKYGPPSPKSRDEFVSDWEYEDYRRKCEISDSLRPDSAIINYVLRMILKDTTGDVSPKRLDKALIRSMFEFYGEMELVNEDTIIEEMIDAASGKNEDGNAVASVLDEAAFARALTSDVLKFDIEPETSLTTHYYDVFHTHYSTKERGTAKAQESEKVHLIPSKGDDQSYRSTDVESQYIGASDDERVRPVERMFTFPSIDYTAGLYRSKLFVVVLWFTAVLTYFSYLYGVSSSFAQIDCKKSNMSTFGCKVANGIINWVLIFLELSIMGTAFICLGSIGNDIYSTSRVAILIGMASVVMFTIIPFRYSFSGAFFSTVKIAGHENRYIHSLCGGIFLLALQLFHLIRLCIPKRSMIRHKRLARFFTPGLVKYEARIKQAAAFKTNRLVTNALEIHQSHCSSSGGLKPTESSYGRALLSFSKFANKYEETGGILWVLQRIWSGTLFTEEGVWLNSRLLAGNASQLFVCLSIVLGGINFIVHGRDIFDDLNALDSKNILPEPWMIHTAIAMGTLCGFLAAAFITLIYIPSSVSTILQFRTGVIPSLRSHDFAKYRASDNERVTLLFGTMFWGAFTTAVCIALLVGFSIILILWQVTRPAVLTLLAQITGITVTILAKMIVMYFLRKAFYAAFYRTRPAPANFVGLAVECWNLGLTTGYMLGRTAMLIIATALYVGRVDVPFLAEGAGKVGPINLDAYPITFRKDLLMHDAHRHPYLERLGFCYMLKLRHGDNFAKTSGSLWRLLFVFALLPWMRKHRIESRPHLREDDVDTSHFKFGLQRMLRKPEEHGAHLSGSDTGQKGDEIAVLEEKILNLEKEIKQLKKKNR